MGKMGKMGKMTNDENVMTKEYPSSKSEMGESVGI